MSQARIPITIVTGFVGSGKTTLILNLLPQLRAENPGYKLALVKNEIGDLNIDTQLAAAAELTGSRELLGDCICCTNVGQIGTALEELDRDFSPDRIVIETSGSAEPVKLMIEVNRLAKETGRYELDGIISVLDAENWKGYSSTSYTAKLQAEQTDLIVINKWEALDERSYDNFLDRLGDLEVDTPRIKSDKGLVSAGLLFGMDAKTARAWVDRAHDAQHHHHEHTAELECLSITLTSDNADATVDMVALESLLASAPRDEVYRIKAVVRSAQPPKALQNGDDVAAPAYYILNWSFGRCTWVKQLETAAKQPPLRMSIFAGEYMARKWQKKIETAEWLRIDGAQGELTMQQVQ